MSQVQETYQQALTAEEGAITAYENAVRAEAATEGFAEEARQAAETAHEERVAYTAQMEDMKSDVYRAVLFSTGEGTTSYNITRTELYPGLFMDGHLNALHVRMQDSISDQPSIRVAVYQRNTDSEAILLGVSEPHTPQAGEVAEWKFAYPVRVDSSSYLLLQFIPEVADAPAWDIGSQALPIRALAVADCYSYTYSGGTESRTKGYAPDISLGMDVTKVDYVLAEIESSKWLPDDYFASWVTGRTGKVYRTRVYNALYNKAPAVAGVDAKLLDNAGLRHECSTDTYEGVDDYAGIHLFQWRNCNYVRPACGEIRITAMEGTDRYSEEGTVDVGVCGPAFWWNVEWDTENVDSNGNPMYQLWTISDSPHPELNLKPWVECLRKDGSVAPYWCHSKYLSGTAGDGLQHSQTGLEPMNMISYENTIGYYNSKGSGYCGGRCSVQLFGIIFDIIKNATKDSQSIHRGNFDSDQPDTVNAYTTRNTQESWFPVSTANAGKISIGSHVHIGTTGDRSNSAVYNKAKNALVTGKEDMGSYVKVLLDCPAYTITSTATYITTAPSLAGETNAVIGRHDGSCTSNSDGRHSYRVQGTEYGQGYWQLCSDVLFRGMSTGAKEVFVCPRTILPGKDYNVVANIWKKVGTIPAAASPAANWYPGDIEVDVEHAVFWPTHEVDADIYGWCDYHYPGNVASGQWRECFVGGRFGNGSIAGSSSVTANVVPSNSGWPFAARD